jgi:hypothetical protein
MRAAEHRDVSELVGHATQGADQAIDGGQDHLLARGLEHQAVAGVVDVFRCAGKVHELAGLFQLGVAGKTLLEPVLDRLHIVVGGFFDVLDGLGIGLREARYQATQVTARSLAQ